MRETGPDGEPRFRMLETIREYGLERLEAGEEAAVRTAHARYFLRFAQSLRPLVMTLATREPFDRLAADDANLHAAASWLDDRGDAAALASMVAACYLFWYAASRLPEAEIWLDRALARRDQVPVADRARLLIGRAELLLARGELERASAVFTEGLSLLRGADGPFDLAMALISYGASLNFAGKYAEGEALLDQALTLAESIADRKLWAAVAGGVLGNLSDSARGLGDLELATARSEEALRRFHGQNFELAETRILLDLGHIARDQGNHRLAVARYLVCIEHTGERGEMRLVAESLEGIAHVATTWGQTQAALLLFGAADALRERVGIGMTLPIDAALVERDRAALSDSVGEQTFAATLAEGRVLPLAEATAIAAAVVPSAGAHPVFTAESPARLTRRERDVLRLLAESCTDREIAKALFLSPRTVSWHVRSILAKLGAASRREAVAQAHAENLIAP